HVYLRCNSSLRNEDRYRASGWSDKPSRIPVEGTRSARERCKARGSVGRETEVRSVSIRDLEQASRKLIVSKPAPVAGALSSRHVVTDSNAKVRMGTQVQLSHEDFPDALKDLVKALGGPEAVGLEVWPAKPMKPARNWLRDGLAPERPAKLDLEEV